MQFPRRKFDMVSVTWATTLSKGYCDDTLKRAEKLKTDPDKEVRLQKQLCPACHYVIGRIGGSAMTHQPCSACGEDQLYGSTCTDALCIECAKKHKLCKHCGGTIDMRRRNKLDI